MNEEQYKKEIAILWARIKRANSDNCLKHWVEVVNKKEN